MGVVYNQTGTGTGALDEAAVETLGDTLYVRQDALDTVGNPPSLPYTPPILIRIETEANRLTDGTGTAGELTWDSTLKRRYFKDGIIPGGIPDGMPPLYHNDSTIAFNHPGEFQTTGLLVASTAYLSRVFVPFAASSINWNAYVTTGQAGGACKAALYAEGAYGGLGAKLSEWTTAQAATTTNSAMTFTIAATYRKYAWYWLALTGTADATMPTLRTIAPNMGNWLHTSPLGTHGWYFAHTYASAAPAAPTPLPIQSPHTIMFTGVVTP